MNKRRRKKVIQKCWEGRPVTVKEAQVVYRVTGLTPAEIFREGVQNALNNLGKYIDDQVNAILQEAERLRSECVS